MEDDSSLIEDGDSSLIEDGDMLKETTFTQNHNDLVLDSTWWWASHLAISSIALIANLVFLITVIYNRY
jgi:hypothetical protein